MNRWARSLRATCGLALAQTLLSFSTPADADGCKLANFGVLSPPQGQKALTREKVVFSLEFRPARGFVDSTASVTLDWGEGKTENTGPRPIRMGVLKPTYLRIEHTYEKPGKYVATVKGGSLAGAPCTFENWFFPATVTVLENPAHTSAVAVAAAPAAGAVAQKKVAVLPTPTPAVFKKFNAVTR